LKILQINALLLFTIIVSIVAPLDVIAKIYYVDYDQGSDKNKGLKSSKPFKHSPGDPDAMDKVKKLHLKPGDKVIFKGGVHYRGNFVIDWSGTKDKPIIFDGNSDGSFGKGKAILDGSQQLSKWEPCKSAADCGGNSNWKKIYKTVGPAGTTCWTAGLLQDNKTLGIAQFPTPKDFDFSDNVGEFHSGAATDFTETTVTHEVLKELGGKSLIGAYTQVFRTTNRVDVRKISAWDEKTSMITFPKLKTPPYDKRDGRFAIVNSLNGKVFDQPGEYVFVENANSDGTFPIYLWPLEDKDPNKSEITISQQNLAIMIRKSRHFITIQGFTIQKYRQAITNRYDEWNTKEDVNKGLIIRNNKFTRIRQQGYQNTINLISTAFPLIENNHLSYNAKQRGIAVHTSDSPVVQNNTLHKVGRTPIVFYICTNGKILNNRITDCTGSHSNGISVYVNCKDILLEGNVVWNSNVPFTCNETTNLTVRNNVFDGFGRSQPIAFWQGDKGDILIENNILIRSSSLKSGFTIGGLGDKTGDSFDMKVTIKNNIMAGPMIQVMTGKVWTKNVTSTGNIYQFIPDSYKLGEGEKVETDLNKLLENVNEHNYTRK